MRLDWERPGVVRVTAKVEELALLVAAGRVAAAAFEGQPGEQADALNQLLRNLDRAIAGLRRQDQSTVGAGGLRSETTSPAPSPPLVSTTPAR